MARSRGRPELLPWVGERLATVGPFTAEAWGGDCEYTFAALPELATSWCQFVLKISVPADPKPEQLDRLLERWQWYEPRHATDSEVFRQAVLELYRACDDFLPRDLPDAEVLAQVTEPRIEISVADARDSGLHAEVRVEFAGEHSPLLEWDESLPGWNQIG